MSPREELQAAKVRLAAADYVENWTQRNERIREVSKQIEELKLAVAEDLAERLADCLAECVDKPLLKLGDTERGTGQIEVRLAAFDRALAEKAAGLLEEAGR